jgi:hypothetical protein
MIMDRRQFLHRASRYAAAAGAGVAATQVAHAIDTQWQQAAQAMDSQWQKANEAMRNELEEIKSQYAAMDKRTKLMMRAMLALAGIDILLLV